MKMNLEKFRIGQLAQLLEVERFVIRFWEKEFNIKADRSDGGQRFYTAKDFEKFKHIKTLLYEQGFTITGAKKALSSKQSPDNIFGSTKTTLGEPKKALTQKTISPGISEQIITLHKHLQKLKELLS